MLIAKLSSLETLLTQRSQLRDQKQLLKNLSNVHEELLKLQERWIKLLDLAARIGCENSIVKEFREIGQAVLERSSQGLAIQQNSINQLSSCVNRLDANLKIIWTERKRSIIDETLKAEFQIAVTIGLPTAQISLRHKYQRIEHLLNIELPTAQQFEDLIAAVSSLRQLIAESVPSMTSSVQSFLERLASGHATLRDLNPEILQWCREQNLLDRIYLNIKGA